MAFEINGNGEGGGIYNRHSLSSSSSGSSLLLIAKCCCCCWSSMFSAVNFLCCSCGVGSGVLPPLTSVMAVIVARRSNCLPLLLGAIARMPPPPSALRHTTDAFWRTTEVFEVFLSGGLPSPPALPPLLLPPAASFVYNFPYGKRNQGKKRNLCRLLSICWTT
jgi:hypothetical protein